MVARLTISLMDKRHFVPALALSAIILVLLLSASPVTVPVADASSNPNLFVSAENQQFRNQFSGSMVIEVVVLDPNINDVSSIQGHPTVTINGDTLLMAQAIDGNWYAYFANVKKAQAADSTVGLPGQGLDFGVFCGSKTPSSVFGVSLSHTEGFTIPRHADGSTNGNSALSACTGSPSGPNLNNVLRNPKSLNTNNAVPAGQIGLDPQAWPLIQLFSFGDVVIEYRHGGSPQQVRLEYGQMDHISAHVDRELYPSDAQVFLTVNDIQLNQDPTDRDSWTFGSAPTTTGSKPSTFYQAYNDAGRASAHGGSGLADLVPHLSRIGFEDNGVLSLDPDVVLEFTTNNEQPHIAVSDGSTSFSNILTLVETSDNSGIFDSIDGSDTSVLKILRDAPRGRAGSITYNDDSFSILTGSSSASISLGPSSPTLVIEAGNTSLKPGKEYSLALVDSDQNTNSHTNDVLQVSEDDTVIPTMRIGDPITLKRASDVRLFTSSTDSLSSGVPVDSAIPDSNSARLFLDTAPLAGGSFEKFSLNLGVTASDLQSVLIDTSAPNSFGTSWINYDFRSLADGLEISDFTDTVITLSFGTLGDSPIIIANPGDLSSAQGLIQLDDSVIQSITGVTGGGVAHLVVNFDSSDDDDDDDTGSTLGVIRNESQTRPIVFDLFSFGLQDSEGVNNAIYRFELEETSDDSSEFYGTLEYSVANQLNILDPEFIKSIRTISDDVKFIVIDSLTGKNGITISYSDINTSGYFTNTSTKLDAGTHSGVLSTNSQSYRFGQTVILTLTDPDLNLRNDLIDVYSVIDDVNSQHVDTVGDHGSILFEVLIKDIRYKRCTIDGVQHGGLGSTGFTLAETGPGTGIFQGSFKIPAKICDSSGSKLISSAGGSVDAKYYDSSDRSGTQRVFTLSGDRSVSSSLSSLHLSTYDVTVPASSDKVETVTLSGSVTNVKRGIPLVVGITTPSLQTTSFGISLSHDGIFRHVIPIYRDSMIGNYTVWLSYDNRALDALTFTVSGSVIPDWINNIARHWSADTLDDSEFVAVLEYLDHEGFLILDDTLTFAVNTPSWVKTAAQWWVDGQITDGDFLTIIQYLVDHRVIVE